MMNKMLDKEQVKADRLKEEGIDMFKKGESQAALQSWQQALKIYQTIGYSQGEVNVLINIGCASHALGQFQQAIECHQQSLRIAQEIRDLQGEAKSLDNLGIDYRSLGEYHQAIKFHQQSLELKQKLNDQEGIAKSLHNLAYAFQLLGQYQQAIDLYQQKLNIVIKVGDIRGEALTLSNLGIIHLSLGQYQKTIKLFQKHLTIAREINDSREEAIALGNLGLAHYYLGKMEDAIAFSEQELTLVKKIKDRHGEASCLNNLGNVYRSQRKYEQAIKFHQQSLTIKQEIDDRQGEANSLGSLGHVYLLLGQYEQAIQCHQQHLTIATDIGNLEGQGFSQKDLGLALFKSGNLPEAEKSLYNAIKAWEMLRIKLTDLDKVSLLEKQNSTYHLLQKVLIDQKKPHLALEIAERGRARSLIVLLAKLLSSTEQQEIPQSPNLEEIKQIAKRQNATIIEYSILNENWEYPLIDPSFTINNDQENQELKLLIWAIKPTGEIKFRIVETQIQLQDKNLSIYDMVSLTRKFLVGSQELRFVESDEARIDKPEVQPELLRRCLNLLYKILVEKIADFLPSQVNDQVIFIPQGSLFLVPFPALLDNSGQYLIEQHTILTAPSIQALKFTQEHQHRVKQTTHKDMLIVGNPTMPSITMESGETSKQLKSLPGAETEAKEVAKLLKTQPLIQNQATKETVIKRMSSSKMIHLATHGLLDDRPDIDLPGAIALAPSPTDDGWLKAAELQDFQLNAELVVLSACDTGQGRLTGEGVIGLSRSFISAGVPSVIVSLWSVQDDSTAFLMMNFYQNLQQGLDKAQALRQAMLVTKEFYPNPFNWAAFTLIGEADSISL